jgi:hypothetical protein
LSTRPKRRDTDEEQKRTWIETVESLSLVRKRRGVVSTGPDGRRILKQSRVVFARIGKGESSGGYASAEVQHQAVER